MFVVKPILYFLGLIFIQITYLGELDEGSEDEKK